MPKSAPPRKTQSAAKQAARRPPTSAPADTAMVVDGVAYPLAHEDLTTLDIVALRRATGFGLPQLAQAAVSAPDLDVVAAWVWLSRRSHGEPGLPFEMVALEITYGTQIDFQGEPTPASTGVGPPEA